MSDYLNPWHKVTDLLPEEETNVLIRTYDKFTFVGYRCGYSPSGAMIWAMDGSDRYIDPLSVHEWMVLPHE